MAKLPDGWVFIPRMKDAITIEVEKRELVTCRNCKNAEIMPWLDNVIICKKHNYTGVRPPNFYCADGEKADD